MSEPIKKPNQTPESYTPKEMPEIMQLAQALCVEKAVEAFSHGRATFEVVERPEVLWVGTLAWAENNNDEPDMGALLKRYQALCSPAPKQARINPDWDAAISINYGRGGKAAKGIMYAQETYSKEQDSRYDLFTQPAGLYLRVLNDKKAAKLLGKKTCETYELFGLLKTVAPQYGYAHNDNINVEIEYHNYKNGTWYAYIPVKQP